MSDDSIFVNRGRHGRHFQHGRHDFVRVRAGPGLDYVEEYVREHASVRGAPVPARDTRLSDFRRELRRDPCTHAQQWRWELFIPFSLVMQRFGNLKVFSVFFIPKLRDVLKTADFSFQNKTIIFFFLKTENWNCGFSFRLLMLILHTAHCIVSPCSENNKTISKHTISKQLANILQTS